MEKKTLFITYSKCGSVAVVIQQEIHMRHIVICGLYGSTIFFPQYLTKPRFSEKNFIKHKMCVLISTANFV